MNYPFQSKKRGIGFAGISYDKGTTHIDCIMHQVPAQNEKFIQIETFYPVF
jgi:hypothetical protein